MPKRIKLKSSEPDSNDNAIMIGIVSTDNILKVAWQINKAFNLQLKDTDPFIVNPEDKENGIDYLRYKYKDKDTGTLYILIQNKKNNTALIKNIKNIDFVLHITDFTEDMSVFIKKLKQLSNVSAVFNIE